MKELKQILVPQVLWTAWKTNECVLEKAYKFPSRCSWKKWCYLDTQIVYYIHLTMITC